MGKRAYQDALGLRLRELTQRAAILRLHWEHAAGREKFRTLGEIRRVERRRRMLQDRLRQLDGEGDGLWQDLKADFRGVIYDLPGGVERWIERLNANFAARLRDATGAPERGAGIEPKHSLR
jgi:hypothetical protein